MFVLVIVGRKCTLAASRAAPCALLSLEKKDGQTDERQTETLRFPLNVVSVKIDTLHVTELNESLRSPQARLEPGGEEGFIPHHAPLTYHASHLLHFKVRFLIFAKTVSPDTRSVPVVACL